VRIVRGVAALAVAALAQAFLSRYAPTLARYCDLFIIVVVYFGLTSPPTGAMLMGFGAGLVEDSLLGSVLGMNGFKKTLIGYLVGSFGSLFMLNQPIPRFGILFVATVFDPIAELGLSLAMGRSFVFPATLDLLQRGLGNGILGLLFFWVATRLP
jgi:rod shape-determining protein MreD